MDTQSTTSRTEGRPRKRLPRILALSLAVSFAAAGLSGAAHAADCGFFKNKTVELVVPFSPGGGFDVYGRMVAKYMGPELGAANMIVRNQPGAGGLLGTNHTWKAKPDGLRIQLMSTSGMVTSELGGADGVEFKSGQFSWIGRVSGEPDVIATGPNSTFKTLEDLKKTAAQRKIRIGSSGVGDIDYIEALLLSKVFEVETDIITGFSGSGEVYTSLGRGEIDLFSSSLSSAEVAEKAATAQVISAFGNDKLAGRDNVMLLKDVVAAKYVAVVQAQSDVVAAGRSLAGPPKLPEDRLQCLREAFDRTMASAAFLDESKKLNRPVAPLTGQQIAGLIRGVTEATPPDYLELLRKAYGK